MMKFYKAIFNDEFCGEKLNLNKFYSMNDIVDERNGNMYVFDPNETMVYKWINLQFKRRF